MANEKNIVLLNSLGKKMAALSYLQKGMQKQLAKLGEVEKLEQSNLDLAMLLAAKTAECETLKQRLD